MRAAALNDVTAFVAAVPGPFVLVRLDERGGRDEPVAWAWDVLLAEPSLVDPDDDDCFIPAIKDPHDLQLIVAGGWGPCTAICHGWSGGSRAVHGTYRCP